MSSSGVTARRSGSTSVLSAIFYGGCALALVIIVFRLQQSFLPAGLSSQIGHNSETFALALALGVSLQYARPRWLEPGGAWVCAAVGLLWIALGVVVYYLGWDSTVITLNEPLFAAGVLTFYAGPRRPWRVALLLPAAILVASVVFFDTQLVLQQAESIVAVVVGMVSIDLFDRGVLDEVDAESPTPVWAGWYAFLLLWPALMLGVRTQQPEGFVELAVDYMARGAEGFWGMVLLLVYLRILRHRSP